MTVLCIHHKGTDPYYSLAIEEYLLKNFQEDVFMLWKSEPSIVVGKHQNALAEINHQYIQKKGIKVARRLSGGGTVFHDPGNLNFTFIQNVERIDHVNFKTFTFPIVDALKQLGLEATTSGRNDLLIYDKKISGNAEHVFKKRVLHHGTLLFDSKLDHLKQALKVDLSRFKDKSVQSNRSIVTNISEHLQEKITIDEFADFLFENISGSYSEKQEYQFSDADKSTIQKLRDEKYFQWEWIYGYSPKYVYSNSISVSTGKLDFSIWVEKGIIRKSEWKGDISEDLIGLLENHVQNCRHGIEELSKTLQPIQSHLQGLNIKVEDL
jgi:lipoate-protein ligase A